MTTLRNRPDYSRAEFQPNLETLQNMVDLFMQEMDNVFANVETYDENLDHHSDIKKVKHLNVGVQEYPHHDWSENNLWGYVKEPVQEDLKPLNWVKQNVYFNWFKGKNHDMYSRGNLLDFEAIIRENPYHPNGEWRILADKDKIIGTWGTYTYIKEFNPITKAGFFNTAETQYSNWLDSIS